MAQLLRGPSVGKKVDNARSYVERLAPDSNTKFLQINYKELSTPRIDKSHVIDRTVETPSSKHSTQAVDASRSQKRTIFLLLLHILSGRQRHRLRMSEVDRTLPSLP